MHTYIHTYIHTCISTHTPRNICIHTYMHTYIHTWMHTSTYMMHICMPWYCIHTDIHEEVCICMYVWYECHDVLQHEHRAWCPRAYNNMYEWRSVWPRAYDSQMHTYTQAPQAKLVSVCRKHGVHKSSAYLAASGQMKTRATPKRSSAPNAPASVRRKSRNLKSRKRICKVSSGLCSLCAVVCGDRVYASMWFPLRLFQQHVCRWGTPSRPSEHREVNHGQLYM